MSTFEVEVFQKRMPCSGTKVNAIVTVKLCSIGRSRRGATPLRS